MGASRCGECRLGLGMHNLADPLCEQREDNRAKRARARAPHVATRGERTSQSVRANMTGLHVQLSRVAEQPLLLEATRTVILPQHSRDAEAAMAEELVACTLGRRQRPELLPDDWSGAR